MTFERIQENKRSVSSVWSLTGNWPWCWKGFGKMLVKRYNIQAEMGMRDERGVGAIALSTASVVPVAGAGRSPHPPVWEFNLLLVWSKPARVPMSFCRVLMPLSAILYNS